MPRVVVLRDATQREGACELIGRPRVENVDRENARAGGVAIEQHAVVADRLQQAPVGLEPDGAAEGAGAALKRLDRIVEDGAPARDVAIEKQPAVQLDVAEGAKSPAVEALPLPMFE